MYACTCNKDTVILFPFSNFKASTQLEIICVIPIFKVYILDMISLLLFKHEFVYFLQHDGNSLVLQDVEREAAGHEGTRRHKKWDKKTVVNSWQERMKRQKAPGKEERGEEMRQENRLSLEEINYGGREESTEEEAEVK